MLKRSIPVFAALGDETRAILLTTLCNGGAKSIAQLTSGTVITRQAVSKHLAILARAGLIKDLKVGRERFGEFQPARIHRARESLESIGRQWDQASGRLKILLESERGPKT